jgi:hypothetical protein
LPNSQGSSTRWRSRTQEVRCADVHHVPDGPCADSPLSCAVYVAPAATDGVSHVLFDNPLALLQRACAGDHVLDRGAAAVAGVWFASACPLLRLSTASSNTSGRLHLQGCILYHNWWPMLTGFMYVMVPMPYIFFGQGGDNYYGSTMASGCGTGPGVLPSCSASCMHARQQYTYHHHATT